MKSDEPLRAVIVDDERLARVELTRLLSDHGSIEIASEAATVTEAVDAINGLEPHVVFLDIQLGAESGFDVLERSEPDFEVVFVTAFDEHAIRAFEVNAVDYLLKPVHPDRLAQAISRLRNPRPDIEGGAGRYEPEDFVIAKGRGGMRSFRVSDIVSIEAVGDYTKVHACTGPSHLVHRTMTQWMDQLPQKTFCRVHRSFILNLEHLDRIEKTRGSTFLAFMVGSGEPLPVSRRHARRLRGRTL